MTIMTTAPIKSDHRRPLLVLAICCAAAVAGLGLAHALEIPGKRRLDGPSFVAVQHNLYGGYAIVGGVGECVGIAAMLGAARRVSSDDSRSRLSLLSGAGALVGALLVFVVGLRPINADITSWTSHSLPADWRTTRDRWDRLHLLSFVLSAAALAATLRSVFSRRAVADARRAST